MAQEQANQMLKALETRFACKRYDPAGHLSESDFNTILEAGRLSPSSFGLEPWKFLVIEQDELLESILSHAWGAKRNADRTVVILARRDVTADSDWMRHIDRLVHGLTRQEIDARAERFADFQQHDLEVLDSERTLFDWASKQTYIALANMLTMAAMLGVDATPIEGFNARTVNEVLSSRGVIDPQEWGVSVLVQFGFHNPSHRPHPKQRRAFSDVVSYVR